jgi:O-antigen ligase
MKKRVLMGVGAVLAGGFYALSPPGMIWMTFVSLATNLRIGGGQAGISFGIQEVFLYSLALGFIIYKFEFKANPIPSPISRDVALYTIVMSVTTLMNIGIEPAHMLSVVRDTVAPWLWYLLFLNFLGKADQREVKKFFMALIWLGVVSTVIAFIQHFTGTLKFYQEDESRGYLAIAIEGGNMDAQPATGLFGWFNAFGMFVQITYFVALVYWQLSEPPDRRKYFWATVFLFLGEYLSFSRGSYLTLIIGTMLVIYVASKKGRVIVLGGAIALALAFAYFVLPFVLEHQEVLETLFARITFWQEGYSYFVTKGNWLYGIGPGMFIKLVGTDYDVHNVYLMHLFENGVPGFLILAWLVYRLLKETLVSVRNARTRELKIVALICFATFVGYFIHELIEHTFYSIVFRMTIFTLAALFVRARYDEEQWIKTQSTISS